MPLSLERHNQELVRQLAEKTEEIASLKQIIQDIMHQANREKIASDREKEQMQSKLEGLKLENAGLKNENHELRERQLCQNCRDRIYD